MLQDLPADRLQPTHLSLWTRARTRARDVADACSDVQRDRGDRDSRGRHVRQDSKIQSTGEGMSIQDCIDTDMDGAISKHRL